MAGAAAYSVDSFSEYSTVAVSRQPVGAPATSYYQQQLEEELFRDLFACEMEPEITAFDRKKPPSFRPSPGIQWTTGATPVMPFPFPQRPHAMPTLGDAEPVVPRLNLSELAIPRPHVEDPSAVVGANGHRPSLLGQVVEEADEEGEDGRPETDVQSDFFPPFRSTAFRSSCIDDNNGKHAIEQETLRFLECLDLKTVLRTPRPEVDSFLPSARSDVSARVETGEERGQMYEYGPLSDNGHQRPAPPTLGPVREAFLHRSVPRSARKGTDQTAAGRLAHVESTYGTTKHEPRKARRETIERLANPIAGYTSTLQALSPEQRRKREKLAPEVIPTENNGSGSSRANTTDKRMESPQKATASLLDQLTSAASVYHMAALSARVALAASPLTNKPCFGQTYHPSIVTTSNNQVEDQLSSLAGSKSGRGGGKSSGRRAAALNARKQALKEKLQAREEVAAASKFYGETAPARDWATTCSTFLTQREDDEADLMLPPTSSRPAVPPLQVAQQRAGATNKSRPTPRATRTPTALSRVAAGDSEGSNKGPVPSLGSTRNRPIRPATRDKSDGNRGGATRPHPPPRPSNGLGATAPTGRRPNLRQPQRKTRDPSSHPPISSARPPSKPVGRDSVRSDRSSLSVANSSKSDTIRKQEPTPSKAGRDRPTTPTAASILLGITGPASAKKAGDGRPRKGSESTKSNGNHGAQESRRGLRVRLVSTRRLSNGSISVGAAGPPAPRVDQKRPQSPSRGRRRGNNNGVSDSIKPGRKAGGPTRSMRGPANTGNGHQQRTAA